MYHYAPKKFSVAMAITIVERITVLHMWKEFKYPAYFEAASTYNFSQRNQRKCYDYRQKSQSVDRNIFRKSSKSTEVQC